MAALKISAPKSTSTNNAHLPLHQKVSLTRVGGGGGGGELTVAQSQTNFHELHDYKSIILPSCLINLVLFVATPARTESSLCQLNLIFIKGFTDENKQPSANTFGAGE